MTQKQDKVRNRLKIGQKVRIIDNNDNSNVMVGDLAIECGYTSKNLYAGWHQFHSTLLVDQVKTKNNYISKSRNISYWVEFLPRHCYEIRK